MSELNYMQRLKTNGYHSFVRRDSLVRQASLDRCNNEAIKKREIEQRRHQLEASQSSSEVRESQVLQALNDEGVDVIWSATNNDDPITTRMQFAAVLTCNSDGGRRSSKAIATVVDALDATDIELMHLETRNAAADASDAHSCDILLECNGTKDAFLRAAAIIESDNSLITNLRLYKTTNRQPILPWFPTSVFDLDRCSNVVNKYEPNLDHRHPGFGDNEYIRRRTEIAKVAANYRHGDTIPSIDYTPDEHRVWSEVYAKLKSLYPTLACTEYRRNLATIEREGIFTPNRIPQLHDVSCYLQKTTGFQLRPCAGLLSARDFLASLAFRVFQATQYVRHTASPHHSPEPDIIHELLGHVPMFADVELAAFSQQIGIVSLGATDEQIEKLSTVYWFIIEFGLCRDANDGQLKRSAPVCCPHTANFRVSDLEWNVRGGYLHQHAVSDRPEHRAFDPAATALQTYQDDEYQPVYYVAESIGDAMNRLRQYAQSFERNFSLVYEPITRSIKVINSTTDLSTTIERVRNDISIIADVLARITTASDGEKSNF